jgi:hypothetical protein
VTQRACGFAKARWRSATDRWQETAAPIIGYNIVDCADIEEALEVAAKHPVATFGTLEVRPIAASEGEQH